MTKVDKILKTFSKMSDQLDKAIEELNTHIGKTSAKINDLYAERANTVKEIERASNARKKIKEIIGE